jgi:hypothetical protein
MESKLLFDGGKREEHELAQVGQGVGGARGHAVLRDGMAWMGLTIRLSEGRLAGKIRASEPHSSKARRHVWPLWR